MTSQRFFGVSASAADLLGIASVLGDEVDPVLLAELAGRPVAALLAPLEEAIAADLLRENGDRLRFRDALVRDAISRTLPGSLRAALRRQAADTRLARGEPVAEVAATLAETAERGDDRAIALLRQAAQDLATTNPEAAAAMGRRAAELLPENSPVRSQLMAETVALEVTARIGLGPAHWSPDEAVRQCRAGLALDGVPAKSRAPLLALLVFDLVLADAIEEAEDLLGEAGQVAEEAGDPGALAMTQCVASLIAFQRGDAAEALELAKTAIRPGPSAGQWMFAMWRCFLLSVVGRCEEALECIAEGIDTARRHGQTATVLNLWTAVRGRVLLNTGRLSDAEAAGGDAVRARIALHTGADHARGTKAVERMVASAVPLVRRDGLWLAALTADGHERVRALLQETAMSCPMDPVDVAALVRIALRAGDTRTAAHAVAVAERLAVRNPGFPIFAAAALHARGLFDRDIGHLRRAVEGFRTLPRPLVLASATEDLAKHLIGEDDAEAAERLDEALNLYENAGASADASRVRRRLAAMGRTRQRNRRRSRAAAPPTGWESLTSSERQVAGLVTEGATNRQIAQRLFLAPQTVSTHLQHAFAKLGVHSRVELVHLLVKEARRNRQRQGATRR